MRRRILITLLASTSIVLVAFLVPLMVIIGDLAVDRAQRQVVLEIQPLVSRIPVLTGAELEDLVVGFQEQTGRQTTIYLVDDETAGQPRPADAAVELARAKGAFFTEVPGGRDLLVPVYTAEGEAVLRVFVPEHELTGAVPRARLSLMLVGAVLLAFSVGAGLLLARSFLRPLSQLGDTAEGLAAGDLTARVAPSGIHEIDTVGRALNRLAGRVIELLGLEREDVADLAHRLRTPVTALRLDVEGLPDADETERLRDDVDHLERLVDEVIREARRPLREEPPATADLCAVTRERVAFWAVLAEDQQRPVDLDIPSSPLYVAAEPRDLGDALDALLGNVFSHTPDGVPFRVTVGVAPGPRPWVEVSDGGPGMPNADVVERGRSVSGSTGLGLDIARRAAERGGGSMVISSNPRGGARVQLLLSPATPTH
jgi:signal transduction histidine kinase